MQLTDRDRQLNLNSTNLLSIEKGMEPQDQSR